ncbi:MAG: cell envelope biogenesis protein OmpA [Cytophagaceae bacterium]|nr:cell envelope biogenesis protein OmpA [Cytophagaceae bacterium]
MKNLLGILSMIMMFLMYVPAMAQGMDKDGLQVTPRVGYDFPTYDNNTPYIDYKGGIEAGLSVDYYWKWFGVGADFDFIKNQPQSTFPTDNLFDAGGNAFTSFNLDEKDITRIFYGIGPDAKWHNKKGNFIAELNTRAGLASIKGGRTLLEGNTSTTSNQLLNFHAGYDDKNVFSAKGQLRFTYLFNKNFGVNVGGYYLRHFNTQEQVQGGLASAYYPFTTADGATFLDQGGISFREEPCDCDIYSLGVFAGVTIKFNKKENVCPVCKKDHEPHCCATCGCNVTITAKDKFTGTILPGTDVVLIDMDGNITHEGTTNAYGVVVFENVKEDNYVIKGKLYDVDLVETALAKADFEDCQKTAGIQKEILYGDENFILKGKVVECNTTEGIDAVDVILKDTLRAWQKNTLSDAGGDFIFHLKQASNYTLKGNKDGYFSNEVGVSTTSYNRNSTLYIDFEMCVNPCGQAIRLDNINFDLDKWDILPASVPDLQKVVNLMKANPTIKVEMSSHTDSRGSNLYNQDLSQKRAQSTVEYLVSQGISRDRLIARGAGETELLNRCADGTSCSEAEHRINRRTEFKVVCPQQ